MECEIIKVETYFVRIRIDNRTNVDLSYSEYRAMFSDQKLSESLLLAKENGKTAQFKLKAIAFG